MIVLDASAALETLVLPFGPGAVVEEEGCGYAARLLALDPCRPEGVPVAADQNVALHRLAAGAAATLQSVMALTLAFLFGLAVRRRFQIA
jgi:hypothetical protein